MIKLTGNTCKEYCRRITALAIKLRDAMRHLFDALQVQ